MDPVSIARDSGDLSAPIDDGVIRSALVNKRLRNHRDCSDTLVIHELGLAHARSRIDVAVINGVVHGYEIKSEIDSLNRLPSQLEVYTRSLQKLTLVVSERHLDWVQVMVPHWCGILLACRGARGSLRLHVVQRATRNPDVDLFVMAHLLWRDEVQEILRSWGANKSTLRAPRAVLYRELVEEVSEARLTQLIKSAMTRRRAWRDRSRPS